jgi:hypothetical protein
MTEKELKRLAGVLSLLHVAKMPRKLALAAARLCVG